MEKQHKSKKATDLGIQFKPTRYYKNFGYFCADDDFDVDRLSLSDHS